MIDARPAHGHDIDPLAAALARAFHDDPAMTWLFGDRPQPAPAPAAALLRLGGPRRHARRGRTVLTADGQPGAAFWDPPNHWRTPWARSLRSAPMMVRSIGPRIPGRCRASASWTGPPREPHWYLSVLGTDPPSRARAWAGRSWRRSSTAATPRAWAPTWSRPRTQNVPFYQRFGFAVTGQIDLPDGPPLAHVAGPQ